MIVQFIDLLWIHSICDFFDILCLDQITEELSDHDADDISCCNEKSREWFLAQKQDQAQTPDSAIKIA